MKKTPFLYANSYNEITKSAVDFLTFFMFAVGSFASSRYPKGRITTLFSPLAVKPNNSSKAAGLNPSIGQESTYSIAAAAKPVPKPIYA